MKKELSFVVLFDSIFIFMLFFSGLFSGVVSDVILYLAFILPLLLAFYARKNCEKVRALPIRIKKDNALLAVPTLFPTLAIVFLVSWLTSVILSYFGKTSDVDVSGNIALVIIQKALITALLEELLFRYVPLAYLSGISKRGAILFSATFFSLIHLNFFQIPYAFVAGLIFAAIDVAFDSIIPSFVLHFLNNVLSIFWIKHSANFSFFITYVSVLFGISIISVIILAVFRAKYAKKFSYLVSEKGRIEINSAAAVFIFAMLLLSASALL